MFRHFCSFSFFFAAAAAVLNKCHYKMAKNQSEAEWAKEKNVLRKNKSLELVFGPCAATVFYSSLQWFFYFEFIHNALFLSLSFSYSLSHPIMIGAVAHVNSVWCVCHGVKCYSNLPLVQNAWNNTRRTGGPLAFYFDSLFNKCAEAVCLYY